MNTHWVTQEELNHIYGLLDFIQGSPSAYHAVHSVTDLNFRRAKVSLNPWY